MGRARGGYPRQYYLCPDHGVTKIMPKESQNTLCDIKNLPHLDKSITRIRLVGQMISIKRLITRSKGEQFAQCVLQDATGEASILVFPRAYAMISSDLHAGTLVAIDGHRNFDPSIKKFGDFICKNLVPLDKDSRGAF